MRARSLEGAFVSTPHDSAFHTLASPLRFACSDYFCTTTCGLWDTSILRPATKAVTCEDFKVTKAFPKGGELCEEECLLA